MNNTVIREKITVGHANGLLSLEERATVLQRGFGAWKGSVKKSLRILSSIRRGLDRNIS